RTGGGGDRLSLGALQPAAAVHRRRTGERRLLAAEQPHRQADARQRRRRHRDGRPRLPRDLADHLAGRRPRRRLVHDHHRGPGAAGATEAGASASRRSGDHLGAVGLRELRRLGAGLYRSGDGRGVAAWQELARSGHQQRRQSRRRCRMNRLGRETSPYLLQHADNPVHWWPWGEEALAEAQRTNRPILLSVGYAACHWCHVMAHESFESPDVAAVMNELFVNIKVDREERPDVDAIYMQALQIMGEHGGWPLTMFCTPKGEPFWGGTYFPTPARYGRPAFVDVLKGVAQTWRQRPQDIETNRAGLINALRNRAINKAVEFPGETMFPLGLLDQVASRIVQECDMAWGGFGQAPKFPSPYVFELLWRGWLRDRSTC